MTTPGKMPYEERERRALSIYEAKVRPLMSSADEGKFVRIDVISGDYEIGESSVDTGRALRARRPDAIMHTIRNHQSYVRRFRSPRIIVRKPGTALGTLKLIALALTRSSGWRCSRAATSALMSSPVAS